MRQFPQNGFTLIEMTVYGALFVVVSVFLIQSVLALSISYSRLQGARDVVASARVAMETIMRETQQAQSVYTPTSVLGATTSQLSLETPLNPPANETKTFEDFYVDNSRLYLKREQTAAVPLTAESVTVDQFRVLRLVTNGRESVQVTLTIASRLSGNSQSSTTLVSSFTPRGNY